MDVFLDDVHVNYLSLVVILSIDAHRQGVNIARMVCMIHCHRVLFSSNIHTAMQ